MARVVVTQQNFNGGEINPSLSNRIELNKYYTSCERISNYIVNKEGNAKFRTGTKYLASTKSDDKSVQFRFIAISGDIYNLIFSDSFLTIYSNDVEIAGSPIASPYLEADLYNIKIEQIKDVAYIVDNNHAPYKLTKTSSTTFTLAAVQFKIPPWLPENLTATTLTPSAITGSITITASASLFVANDVYRYIKIRRPSPAGEGYARITSYTSPTVVNATVIVDFADAVARDTWSFSPVPTCLETYQARLFFGYSTNIWGSRIPADDGTERYEDFETGTSEEDAFIYSSAKMSPNILWLASNDKTLFGASEKSIFLLDDISSTQNTILSITNPPKIKQIGSGGSKNINPVKKDNIVFFVSKDGGKLNTINYSLEIEGFNILDTSLLSDDLIKSGIIQIEYQEEKDNIVWCVLNDGTLGALNYEPEQQIFGWFRFKTDGFIESVVAIEDSNDKELLYLTVKRTINSVEKRYIEILQLEVDLPNELDYYTENNKTQDTKSTDETAFKFATYESMKGFNYLDSHIVYDGSAQSVTMTPSAITGDDITFTAGGALFVAGDVGRQIWEKSGTGRAEIISYINDTTVKCNILSDFASTSAIAVGNWYFTTSTITGLPHLEGESVNAIIDGGIDPDSYTVVSGSITLTSQASKVTVGKKYIGMIKLLALEGGSQNGSSRIKPKNIDRVGIALYNSVGGEIGTDLYKLEEIIFGAKEIVGRPILPFTGIKEVSVRDSSSNIKNLYVLQRDSQPMNIQLISTIMEANEPA